MARTWSISFPIALVISAIAYLYTTTIFLFIDRRYGLITSPGIMNVVAFTFLTELTVYAYTLAVITDPGSVPASFTPDVADDTDSMVLEVKRKNRDLRYCQKCSRFKPPRAHHCRVCKRCVLKMDHHWIWINNCVGHANYKFFFVFLVYALVTCLYSLVLCIGSYSVESPNKESVNASWLGTTHVMTITETICGVLCAGLAGNLFMTLITHIGLILKNMTTIEFSEGVRALRLVEGAIHEHPYDLGADKNLSLILGPSIPMWVWPTSEYIVSGLQFPTIYDNQGAASSRR